MDQSKILACGKELMHVVDELHQTRHYVIMDPPKPTQSEKQLGLEVRCVFGMWGIYQQQKGFNSYQTA